MSWQENPGWGRTVTPDGVRLSAITSELIWRILQLWTLASRNKKFCFLKCLQSLAYAVEKSPAGIQEEERQDSHAEHVRRSSKQCCMCELTQEGTRVVWNLCSLSSSWEDLTVRLRLWERQERAKWGSREDSFWDPRRTSQADGNVSSTFS